MGRIPSLTFPIEKLIWNFHNFNLMMETCRKSIQIEYSDPISRR